jgi:maleylpyruvate isomerase
VPDSDGPDDGPAGRHDDRPAGDVALAADAHRRLVVRLDALVAAGALDVAAPSRLPGWTRGHVLAHLRQSGDGHAEMLEAAERGEVGVQYPGGPDGRAAAIEADAGFEPDRQVTLLHRSIERLEAAWSASTWSGVGQASAGMLAVRELPFMRAREVEVHHVDLDVGYEFDDLPADYVRLELRRMEMLWRARRPMGMTALPAAALAARPPERLAWLLGRAEIEGLGPASIF